VMETDSQFSTAATEMRSGTVFCLLCRGIVSYNKDDRKRFDDHMNIEHGAFYNLKFLLAGCLMNDEERNVVAEMIEERQETKSNVNDSEGVAAENGENLSILDKAFPLGKGSSKNSALQLTFPAPVSNIEELDLKFECSLCKSTFASKRNLGRHMRNVHKKKIVSERDSDSQCLKEKENEINDSTEPMIEDVDVNDVLKVKIEEGAANNPTNNDELLNSHKCPLCDGRFTRSSNLDRHINNQHPDTVGDTAVFKCDLCDNAFTKASSLKIHSTMKHKAKEKLEEKLLISSSLFSKKIDKNHTHAHNKQAKKKESKGEENQEDLLLEEPLSLDISDVSLDLDDECDTSQDNSRVTQRKSMSKEALKAFNEKRAELMEKSEYFKKSWKNLQAWLGSKEDLVQAENLPSNFCVKHCVTASGRRYSVYVTPDREFKLRSLVAVLEYMKVSDKYSEDEIRNLEASINAKTVSPL